MRRNLLAREAGTLVLLVLVFVGAGLKEPRFWQADSLNSILLWIPLLVVVGMGQMLVIVTRGIDVSVGSMVGLSGMLVGMLFKDSPSTNVYFAMGLGLLIGAVLGSLNGLLITRAKVPPIIATLGTLSAYRGLAFIVSGSKQIDGNNLPDALTRLSLTGPIHMNGVTVPWILLIALAIAGLAAFIVRSTRFGRDVFTLGSNPGGARLRGVPVIRTTFLVYALTGALAGLAGVLYASRFGFVNPASAGSGLELVVIAAVVIGGTKVSGGSGSVLGVLLGCLLLGTINVALSVLGIEATWQMLVYGVVILIALLVDKGVQGGLSRMQEAK